MTPHDLRRPLSRVLVPLDLSPCSPHVLERAAHLPLAPQATLTLLHVAERGPLAPAERALAALAERLPASVNVRRQVVVGSPLTEIVRHAQAEQAEVVVLGRDEYGALADALGQVPVLVVHGRSTRAYRRALVAIDLSESSRAATEVALHLLAARWAELRLVHAGDEPEVTLAMLDFIEPYASLGVTWELADHRGDARPIMLAELASSRADLLVLGLRRRARSLVRAAHCDVLVAHPQAAHA
jgi:nucleotide-binding universal stress UspA family protein